MAEPMRWKLRYLCCGIPLFTEHFATWEEADARREFITVRPDGVVDGHDRVGIIEENVIT